MLKNTLTKLVVFVGAIITVAAVFFVIFDSMSTMPAKPESDRDYLVTHALELVNKERTQNGLLPLRLSSNGAAQAQAQEILSTRTVSHWLTNGEKPYLAYSKYGGSGGMGQNVMFRGATDIKQCLQTGCEKIEPIKQLEQIHYDMMYNDEEYEWGNKGNILDPKHTDVSFGIAFDQYSFVLVQNFEYNYINLSQPIGQDPANIEILGELRAGTLYNISVYYDPFPTQEDYHLHKNEKSYGFGKTVGVVERPLPPNSFYEKHNEFEVITAKNMTQTGNKIYAEFDISKITVSPGIYTLTVWLKIDDMFVPATVHPIFVKPSAKGSI